MMYSVLQMFSKNLVTKPMKDEEVEREAQLELEQEQQRAAATADESIPVPEMARDQSTACKTSYRKNLKCLKQTMNISLKNVDMNIICVMAISICRCV